MSAYRVMDVKNVCANDVPCKPDCPDRKWNCHIEGNCPAYDEWKKRNDEVHKKMREDNFKRFG